MKNKLYIDRSVTSTIADIMKAVDCRILEVFSSMKNKAVLQHLLNISPEALEVHSLEKVVNNDKIYFVNIKSPYEMVDSTMAVNTCFILKRMPQNTQAMVKENVYDEVSS